MRCAMPVDEGLNLSALPQDLLAHILSHLSHPAEISRVSSCATSMAAAAADDALWCSLFEARYKSRPPDGGVSCRDAFLRRWNSARKVLMEVPLPDANAMATPSPAQPFNYSPTATGLTTCSGWRTVDPSACDGKVASVDRCAYEKGVACMAEAISSGAAGCCDIVDWLLDCDAKVATEQPLRVLTMVDLLNTGRNLPYEHLADSWHECERLRDTARKPAWGSWRASLKWSTWSMARDCRGIRARDELHRLGLTLEELSSSVPEPCCQDATTFWHTLARGVKHEVRQMRVLVDMGDTTVAHRPTFVF